MGPRLEPQQGARYYLRIQTARWPTQSYIKYTPGLFSRGKAAEAWRQTPTPSSAEVTERVQYTSTPPLSLQGLSQGELYLHTYLHHASHSVCSMGSDPTERISVKSDI